MDKIHADASTPPPVIPPVLAALTMAETIGFHPHPRAKSATEPYATCNVVPCRPSQRSGARRCFTHFAASRHRCGTAACCLLSLLRPQRDAGVTASGVVSSASRRVRSLLCAASRMRARTLACAPLAMCSAAIVVSISREACRCPYRCFRNDPTHIAWPAAAGPVSIAVSEL